jgi:hypothetical protein
MDGMHISVHDAERYYLGMVTEEEELAPLEHLLGCHACLDLVLEIENYVDLIRVALLYTSEIRRVRHVNGCSPMHAGSSIYSRSGY